MNFSEALKELFNQHNPGGGDLTEAVNWLSTMASAGKTPLGLNQWQRSDKPVMDDFNEDNRIIDETLRGLITDKADKTALQQGLAGKVNGQWTMYNSLSALGIAAGSETISGIVAKMPASSTLSLYVNTQGDSADIYPVAYGTLQIVKAGDARTVILFFDESAGRMWTGGYYQPSDTWKGWSQVASAEPPVEYKLPAGSGYSSDVRYCREDNGILHLYGGLVLNSGSISSNAVVATLPAGYRPTADTALPASFYGSSGFSGGGVRILANGQIQARPSNTTSTIIYLALSFATKR